MYVHTSPKKGPQLLCFVPDELMNEADKAVGHNPEACVFWINPAEVFGRTNWAEPSISSAGKASY